MNVPKKAATGQHGAFTPVARQGFKLELEATFDAAIYAGSVWVGIFAGGDEPLQYIQVPLRRFESEEEAARWAAETIELFKLNWRDVMGTEMARHFANIGRWHLYKMGRAPYSSIEGVITEQVKQTEKNLREWFRLRVGRGHPSKWSSKELAEALLDILTEKNPALTWPGLREELNAREPERAPKSGNALRVLAGRFDLKLRALRKEAAKRRRLRQPKATKPKLIPKNEG